MAKFKGKWVSFYTVKSKGIIYLLADKAGAEPMQFELPSSDRAIAYSVKEKFEDLRAAWFQVKAGGKWYWVDRIGGSNVDNMICSVYGRKPVPEIIVAYPGPFEREYRVASENIEAVRFLQSNSILDDFFDIC